MEPKTIELEPACKNCGSVVWKIEDGRGPHAMHLRCAGCDRGGRWANKQLATIVWSKLGLLAEKMKQVSA